MDTQICPVCKGNGRVANGFYNQEGGQWLTTSAEPEMCRSCFGKGYIYVPEEPMNFDGIFKIVKDGKRMTRSDQ